MERIYKAILESIPYPIVFVNPDHEIVYINKRADEVYHRERNYPNIVGQSIFHCHNGKSREKILGMVDRFKKGGGEEFLSVTKNNERIFVTPVRNEENEFLGYYERYEMNEEWKVP